jgi:GT2 family glycosyltransferase
MCAVRAPTVSVVICAYTLERWDALSAAVASAREQTAAPSEILLVVDHNPALAARAGRELAGVRVVESTGQRGLSGARNCGVAAAAGSVVAFLDDDAVAAPDWLERLGAHYADPRVLGVGGTIAPVWIGTRPRGFPPEFDWVVGCTYRGIPQGTAEVRNLIGANMSLRRGVITDAGGFRCDLGRVGRLPAGCEETELCIRAARRAGGVFVHEPRAHVSHAVPRARGTWSYFSARCIAEGLSKARVSRSAGSGPALATERAYVTRTLPAAVFEHLVAAARGDVAGIARAGAIVAGVALTGAGYLVGLLRPRWPAHAGGP